MNDSSWKKAGREEENKLIERLYAIPVKREDVVIDRNKLYRLAYISELTDEWVSCVGSYEYLHGIYTTLIYVRARNYEIVRDGTEKRNQETFLNALFLELDENLKPVCVLSSIVLTPEVAKFSDHSYVLSDRSENIALRDINIIEKKNTIPFTF